MILTLMLDRFGTLRVVENYTVDFQALVSRSDAPSRVALVLIRRPSAGLLRRRRIARSGASATIIERIAMTRPARSRWRSTRPIPLLVDRGHDPGVPVIWCRMRVLAAQSAFFTKPFLAAR